MGPSTPLALDLATYNWLWGYLIPLGLLMLMWGGLAPEKARRVAPVAAAATALAIVSYWMVGFGLHMGGAYVITEDPALQGLQRMLPLVPGDARWGVFGLSGFFLAGETATSTAFYLFLAYLPLIATAVLLATIALAQTRRWVMVAAGLFAGAFVVPVAACWMWGSGWLAHIGETLGLGHGYVDFGGSTLILWLPGMLVLPILLLQPRAEPTRPPEPPHTYAPFLANVGALVMGIGWLGWSLSQPFHVAGAVLDWQRTALNVLLGMAGAVVTAQLYAWLMTGKPEALLASQGLGAGWGAILSCAPFLPPWGALITGLLAGLAFPLLHYSVRVVLRIRDAAAAVALALTSGPIGLLGLTLFADGQWGQGWNGVGPGIGSIFVTGTGQVSAQLVGLVAVALWGLLWGSILGVIASPRILGRWTRANRAHRAASRDLPTEAESSADSPPTPASAEHDGASVADQSLGVVGRSAPGAASAQAAADETNTIEPDIEQV
ncbi:MAG: hypothetical protein ACP5HG_03855 [Anaerolineae bacterium]